MSYSLKDVEDRAFEGYEYQVRAAAVLGWSGFNVLLSKYEIRKPNESAARFAKTTDLKVSLDLMYWQKIEVKSNNLEFGDNQPFPYSSIALYNVNKRDRDISVILFSTVTKDFLCFCDDGSQRIIKTITDKQRGYTYDVYAAPHSLVLPLKVFLKRIREKLEG